jgi:hypothetical protein
MAEQKRPPWGCTHNTYELAFCGRCVRDAEEHEIRLKLIAVLDRLAAVLESRG